MAKRNRKPPSWWPIDDPHEWIFYDWESGIILRNLQLGVAKSSEFRMPDRYRLERGCRVIRLDTNQPVDQPLTYLQSTITPRIKHIDFFDGVRFEQVQCEIRPHH